MRWPIRCITRAVASGGCRENREPKSVFFASLCVLRPLVVRPPRAETARVVRVAGQDPVVMSVVDAHVPARAPAAISGCRMTRRLICNRAKRSCHLSRFHGGVRLQTRRRRRSTSIGRSVRWARSDARHASIVFEALNAGTTQVTVVLLIARPFAGWLALEHLAGGCMQAAGPDCALNR